MQWLSCFWSIYNQLYLQSDKNKENSEGKIQQDIENKECNEQQIMQTLQVIQIKPTGNAKEYKDSINQQLMLQNDLLLVKVRDLTDIRNLNKCYDRNEVFSLFVIDCLIFANIRNHLKGTGLNKTFCSLPEESLYLNCLKSMNFRNQGKVEILVNADHLQNKSSCQSIYYLDQFEIFHVQSSSFNNKELIFNNN